MKWHLILFSLILFTPEIAASQDIRRCVRPDGTIIFTDKSCSDDDIEKQVNQVAATKTPNKKTYPTPPSCNRTTSELLYSVRTAIDMRDANLLARHYHWAGMSSAQAENILNRLELVVTYSLMDIRLLYSGVSANTISPDEDAYALDSSSEPLAETHKQEQAYAIKIVQYHSTASSQQQSTVFKLQPYYGCYWIRF